MAELKFSQSPHIKSSNSTRKIMLNVVIALLPAVIMGVIYFGIPALLTIITSTVVAVVAEIVYEMVNGKQFKDVVKKLDCSSVVTGLIIALISPANYHLYIPAIASIFAIVVVKMIFGGTGKNLVNPAAAGRIVAFISFTTIMNNFIAPNVAPLSEQIITGATSLQSFLSDGSHLSALDLLLGTGVAGCIGETCKIAILVGGIYLAIRKIINIIYPVISIVVAGVVAVMLNDFNFAVFLPAILSGGLIFGAVFMATDYVTNPISALGKVVFFVGFGLLTSVLRHFTGYETASFAILLMNILVPLIDKCTISKPFGYKKAKKEVK